MKATILVVDDEEGLRFTFKTFLADDGYEVLTAASYSSAMEIISEREPDLIFADILLDDHTGIEILRQVRERGMICPVIIITGQPDIHTAADSVRLGAFDYLIKPIRQDKLLRAARIAIEHTKLATDRERYRNHLEAIFRSVTDAIITVDNEMRIIGSNPAVKEVCGVRSEDVNGRFFDQVFGERLAQCRQVIRETLEKQKTVREYHTECRRKDQARQVFSLNCSSLTDTGGRSIGAVLVIRDITRLTVLENELKERYSFHNIVGKSKKMQKVFRLVEDLANVETTVLITGASGTGKELIARALHYSGVRSHKPLIPVNCSALSENLLESELFGHVRGSFTGAVKDKMGCFQAAHGGTIFLDEIGEISSSVQVKLLRVLQEKTFNRVGDTHPIKGDVRVIAATNRKLREEVRLGNFREDLYYRIKVVEIALPSLRERPEDIPLLVRHFCEHYNKRFNKKIEGVTDETLRIFMTYHWPGNIRELKHAIEHAYVLCHGKNITSEHIPSEITESFPASRPENKSENAEDIMRVLEKTDWNKAKAARILGIDWKTLYRKIRRFNISRPSE